MQQRDVQRLEKIIEYCQQIASTVSRYGDAYDCFKKEYERSTNTVMQWNQIRGMRNIVVHGYGNIDLSVVWGTIKEDIPALEKFCKQELLAIKK